MDQSNEHGMRDWYALMSALCVMAIAAVALKFIVGTGTMSPHSVEMAKLRSIRGGEVVTSVAGHPAGVLFSSTKVPLGLIAGDKESAPFQGLEGEVVALADGPTGLWVGTRTAGTASATPMSRLYLTSLDGASAPRAIALPGEGLVLTSLVSSLDRLWIGTNQGLFSYDWSGVRAHRLPLRNRGALSVPDVTSMVLDSQGLLWIGSSQGLLSYNGSSVTRYGVAQGLPSDHITALATNGMDLLLCGTDKGLSILERGQWTRQAALTSPVTALAASDDDLWVGTDAGLHHRADGYWFNVGTKHTELKKPINALAYGLSALYVATTDGLVELPQVPAVVVASSSTTAPKSEGH